MAGIVTELTGYGKAFRASRAPELLIRQRVVERIVAVEFLNFFFRHSVVSNWNT